MTMAKAWVTTADLRRRLERLEVVCVEGEPAGGDSGGRTIRVDEALRYQTMDGFGASFTDASAFLVHQVLGRSEANEVMERLFDSETGIGLSFLRQPMGACDFNAEMYSYDERPEGEEDFELAFFSIDHDRPSIIPLLQDALRRNPELKIMASPWSPPGWMKTSGKLIGGTLRRECYGVYADYFVRFIQAYAAEGLPIYAVTVQNEPGYEPPHYPGMLMSAEEQVVFIRDYLGPAFALKGIDTLILCYDHNWDITDYTRRILADPGVASYVAGSAWHCYGGRHEAMGKVGEAFPGKGIWFTEASGGEWIWPMREAFQDQMRHVVRCARNGAKTVVWWNIALDEHNGPTVLPRSTCRGLLRIAQETGGVEYNLDYYTMGHIAKFVRPGAVRLASDSLPDDLETAAFRNPDGAIVLILSNQTAEDKTVELCRGSCRYRLHAPGDSAITLTLPASGQQRTDGSAVG